MSIFETNASSVIGLGHVNNPVLIALSNNPNNQIENNRTQNNFLKTDYYNNINKRLTFDFHNTSTQLLTPTKPQFPKSRILTISPARLFELSIHPVIRADPDFNIINMGKMQEFREKVGVSQVSMPRKDIWRCLVAEFLGTFLLVLVGCGCTLAWGQEKLPLVGIALCFGLLIQCIGIVIGHVSGGHINPAVTIAMLVTRKIELMKACLYIIVQIVAAIAGAGVLKVLSPEKGFDEIPHNYGATTLGKGVTELQGFTVEFILTFVLVFMVFAVSDENRHDLKGSGALTVGLGLVAIILYGAPITGASLNPARTLGPCVILGEYPYHWIYWLGPIGGAVVAAVVYQHIFRALRPDELETIEIENERKIREREIMKENSNGISPVV